MNKTVKKQIIKFHHHEYREYEDEVIVEMPLTIYINEKAFATLLCTPEHLDELVIGYLFSEHLIESISDMEEMVIDVDKGLAYVTINRPIHEWHRQRYITSGCATSSMYYDTLDAIKIKQRKYALTSVSKESIMGYMKNLNDMSELFKATGGVHLAAAFRSGEMLVAREDIGRHNAVDKIIGYMLKNKLSKDSVVLCVTGRLSSEMVLKALKFGITIVVSRSAATSNAINIALENQMVLMGFVRGEKANLYSGIARLQYNESP